MNPSGSQPITLTDDARELAASILSADGSAIDWTKVSASPGQQGNAPDTLLTHLRHILACGSAALRQRFLAGETTAQLIADRARLVDLVICGAWRGSTGADHAGCALVAVGGYGRGELHPCSDVDLLVLLPAETAGPVHDGLSVFLTLLWDAGIEIRHSVRNARQCRQDAEQDLTVLTTLMESRLLLGPEQLLQDMQAAIAAENIWSSRDFFEGKLREQQARHHRYDDTVHNLEPDVKGSPGGLRDIHTIAWVARREFGSENLDDLVRRGFLSAPELRLLLQGREFLWRIRFALHLLTGRHEDRLLFDHQARIAQLFGYQDATYMLAVEQLMQRYYRTVMDLSRLNEMILQQFQEAILSSPDTAVEAVNERFQVRNGFLQVTTDDVFDSTPSALLELFLVLQQHPDLKGVSAGTISLIRRSLNLIDDGFRQDPRNHRLFLQILRAKEGVTHELRRMNRYGVLGRYVVAFGRIVGRMQYDLFHAYTVDEHTLFVVSNLRRFALARYDHEYPRCSEIMRSLPAPELAYLAGLFHDIAKGRGGDHSELGALDAESFVLEHGMSRYDARLVAWLVRHHLSLSLTAQKRDISDPAIISEFAALVGDEVHLDYLYLLTVADVRGTNPKLWNSWKAQLFDELYSQAKRALRRGLENPIDRDELVAERRAAARILPAAANIPAARLEEIWSELGDEYFLRYYPEEIAWHTRLLAAREDEGRRVLVGIQDEVSRAGTSVITYAPEDRYTFAIATAVLDELGLNIADARIIRLNNGFRLSTYVVLESGEHILDSERREQIRQRLEQAITDGQTRGLKVTRRPPRQVRMFTTPTLVTFGSDDINNRTVIEIVASDRPGLLGQIGLVLRNHDVGIQAAKILTVGERAEDVFYVTDPNGNPLTEAACQQIEAALILALDNGS
ncbi:MAG: [protein-PII] uridylyltransferase [Gammaproteobacteria bacterium]